MKKIFFSVVTAVSFAMVSQAQFKTWFVNQEESVNYEFYKRDIEIIGYDTTGSKLFAEKAVEQNSILAAKSRSRVAVMPMIYMGSDNESRTENMRFYLQEMAIDYLRQSSAGLMFLDAVEINSMLRKKGINEFNMREYTARELANLLNVEYVIMGTVLQDMGNEVTVFNGYNHSRDRIEYRGKERRVRGRDHYNGSSVTRQSIETRVTFSIYNESGDKIYNASKRSILSGPHAYKYTIQYLLKRTPLYNR